MEGELNSRPQHDLMHGSVKSVDAVLRSTVLTFYKDTECKDLLSSYLVTGTEEWKGEGSRGQRR
jgi:hypothetical protein